MMHNNGSSSFAFFGLRMDVLVPYIQLESQKTEIVQLLVLVNNLSKPCRCGQLVQLYVTVKSCF